MAREKRGRFRDSFFAPVSADVGHGTWQPAMDVYRTRDGWLVKFDLAGVRPEDVRVSVSGHDLTVDGTRRDWSLEDGCCQYRMEIAYSRFERHLTLPDNLERAQITLEQRQGMLLVRINVGREVQ
jgi:HSP20 family protein